MQSQDGSDARDAGASTGATPLPARRPALYATRSARHSAGVGASRGRHAADEPAAGPATAGRRPPPLRASAPSPALTSRPAQAPVKARVTAPTGRRRPTGSESRLRAPFRWRELVGGVAVGMIAVMYTGVFGAYADSFEDRALPGAVVAGQPVGGMTRDEVAGVLDQRLADVHVTLEIDSNTVDVDLEDAGVQVDVAQTVDRVFAEGASTWSRVAGILSAPVVEPVVEVDHSAPRRLAQTLPDEIIRAGRDADVAFDAAAGRFTVTEPAPGKTLQPDAVIGAARRAADGLTPVTERIPIITDAPVVSTEHADPVSRAATDLIAPAVAVKTRTGTVTATPEQKAAWVEIPREGTALSDPRIDPAKVAAWVKETAEASNADAVDGVRAVTAAGKQLATPVPGEDGHTASNTEAVAEGITAALASGTEYSGSFEYERTPAAAWSDRVITGDVSKVPYAPTGGERWAVVDLKQNHAFLYEGTKQVGDPLPFVPGDPRMPTPTGTFHVLRKVEVDRMIGTDWDDVPYDIPNVHYVTYFTDVGHAFHEASWMDHFGWSGTGGSHGCLNMPTDTAKAVYDFLGAGDAVVVHD